MSKILITSALPYINGVKHLGNLVGSLLPADVHARFRRQIGDEVLFICGTDEHGTPAELGALDACQEVRSFCNAQHELQADVYRRFGLSFDHFVRSSCGLNHALTQPFYRRLDAAGLIDEHSVHQVWSPIRSPLSPGSLRARHLSALRLYRRARRPVRWLREVARSGRFDPTALGAIRRHAVGIAREPPPVSAPIAAGRSTQCLA